MENSLTILATDSYRRRAPTQKEVLDILQRQGADIARLIVPKGAREKAIWNSIESQGLSVPCGNRQKCATLIFTRADCIRDHKISLRRVPPEQRAEHDKPWNQWYLCKACDRTKTSKRGIGGLGSDAAQIAKLRRVERKDEGSVCQAKIIPSRSFQERSKKLETSKPRLWPKRSFPKTDRKIQSRPFPKRDA